MSNQAAVPTIISLVIMGILSIGSAIRFYPNWYGVILLGVLGILILWYAYHLSQDSMFMYFGSAEIMNARIQHLKEREQK